MSSIKRPELLAPAGDMERLLVDIQYGADAIYLGGTAFGMRAAPSNFTMEQLKEAVTLAHSKGVKIYLTCNTVPLNSEIEAMPEFMEQAQDCGVDAFIITDLGVLNLAKKYAPKVDIHISTQAGIVNYASANAFYDLGATRVVTARELSMNDIMELRAKTNKNLEIECFVHGAMCVSFSGRCLLSTYLVGRDSNRGDCAQPCRWKYNLVEEKRPNMPFPIEQDATGTYIMNAKDMCMIEHIPELIAAGIDSFKIEGRAKSAYYAAVTTNAYRCAIDDYLAQPKDDYKPQQWILDEMDRVSHRQYCTGFYYDRPIDEANVFNEGVYIRDWDVVAIVDDYKDGYIYATQRNRFFVGDEIEIMLPKTKPVKVVAEELLDENGESIDATRHAMMKFRMKCDVEAPKGAILRKQREQE
ncbi:MAG: U32 family peptidase [Clostridiales bacterium]|nr:U32 family peptidase [Clostridiales bacterium]